MRPLRSLAITAVAVAAALLPAAPAIAAGGGNSLSAQSCQKRGWQNLVRSDGSTFANQDDCVSCAARGGKLQPRPTATLTGVVTYPVPYPHEGFLEVDATGTGLLPKCNVKVTDNSGSFFDYNTVDGAGNHSSALYARCGFLTFVTHTATTASGSPITYSVPVIPC